MLDRYVRPLIDPMLGHMGRRIAAAGVSANNVTLLGLGLGAAAGLCIVLGQPLAALALILASRLLDGLDGAVARATRASDLGGYLDIVADFAFYALVPLAFVVTDPLANGLAGAALLATFYLNGAAFLGHAILAEKHRLTTRVNGQKSWYHIGGLLEGTETIAFFVLLCLMPDQFAPLAWGFAALCLASALGRMAVTIDRFGARR